MPVNSDKPQLWKKDIARSVDLYNDWFIKFAPQAYRSARAEATVAVENALKLTKNLTDLSPAILRENPSVLPMLRMSTAPPIARDRLIGLSGIPAGLVFSMEIMEINKRVPRPSKTTPKAFNSSAQGSTLGYDRPRSSLP